IKAIFWGYRGSLLSITWMPRFTSPTKIIVLYVNLPLCNHIMGRKDMNYFGIISRYIHRPVTFHFENGSSVKKEEEDKKNQEKLFHELSVFGLLFQ
ncbi:MAG: hypothetical protein DRJ02_13195, partial [Bacteroidetes bacterium]